MKILLINPSQTAVYGKMYSPCQTPLGLAYIAAVLEKEGHDVKAIDIDAEKISKDEFIKIIKDGFELIGITATTPTFNEAEKLCEIIKENTEAITIIGGIHATISPDICKSKFIDFVVNGEGEVTILELISAIKGKKNYNKIKGISFKKDNKIIHNPIRELISNLDEIPFPARHLFNQQKYTYPNLIASPVMPVIISRGCPNNCTYCCTKKIFGYKVRFRSAKNVVDEIEQLIEDYNVKEIHFWDDNYILDKKRVFEIRDELKKRNINLRYAFPNGLRVDRVDEEILRCLKDMGTYSLAFGVESGNQKILDNAKKGITLKQVENAYRLAKKLGFETWGFFMIGLPGETKETIMDTIKFAKKINPDVAKFHLFQPYPGTEAFNQLKERGLITNFDYSKYGFYIKPVHKLDSLSEDDLLRFGKSAYRKFYLRPFKIVKELLRMTKSWERFKLSTKSVFYVLKAVK